MNQFGLTDRSDALDIMQIKTTKLLNIVIRLTKAQNVVNPILKYDIQLSYLSKSYNAVVLNLFGKLPILMYLKT